MLRLLLAAALTGSATTLGTVPFLVGRDLSRRAYDTLLGFGAGLMLAAATLGLLPEALRGIHSGDAINKARLALVLLGFGTGVALLSLMDRLIPHEHAGGHHRHHEGQADAGSHEECQHPTVDEKARHQGILVLGAMSLHRLPEGFAIGAGFASGALRSLGVVLAIAVGIQNAVEGAVMAAPLRRGGLSSARLLILVAATGLAVPAAALIGFWLSELALGALPAALSVGAGALIYLACNEIIPESHSHANERRATFGLLLGFVTIIVVQAVAGHE